MGRRLGVGGLLAVASDFSNRQSRPPANFCGQAPFQPQLPGRLRRRPDRSMAMMIPTHRTTLGIDDTPYETKGRGLPTPGPRATPTKAGRAEGGVRAGKEGFIS